MGSAILAAATTTTPAAPKTTGSAGGCEACLAGGGTWQPEASACTTDCDLMDISCFKDACPGACAADNCGDCFSQDTCEGAGCTWNVRAEAMWCTQ